MSGKIIKPLLRKAYGSIPHLPGSKTGPTDSTIGGGQFKIACEKARKGDIITVQEKLDGSCTAVARIDGKLIPLIRKGYPAITSHREQHHLFHHWVIKNSDKFEFLREGQRVVGEWLAQAHGTLYDLTGRSPFVAFDLFLNDLDRVLVSELEFIARENGLTTPPIFSCGPACSIELAMGYFSESKYGGLGPPEGAIWRVESLEKYCREKMKTAPKTKFNFIAKYVRSDYELSKYAPELTDSEPVWNWRP